MPPDPAYWAAILGGPSARWVQGPVGCAQTRNASRWRWDVNGRSYYLPSGHDVVNGHIHRGAAIGRPVRRVLLRQGASAVRTERPAADTGVAYNRYGSVAEANAAKAARRAHRG